MREAQKMEIKEKEEKLKWNSKYSVSKLRLWCFKHNYIFFRWIMKTNKTNSFSHGMFELSLCFADYETA